MQGSAPPHMLLTLEVAGQEAGGAGARLPAWREQPAGGHPPTGHMGVLSWGQASRACWQWDVGMTPGGTEGHGDYHVFKIRSLVALKQGALPGNVKLSYFGKCQSYREMQDGGRALPEAQCPHSSHPARPSSGCSSAEQAFVCEVSGGSDVLEELGHCSAELQSLLGAGQSACLSLLGGRCVPRADGRDAGGAWAENLASTATPPF